VSDDPIKTLTDTLTLLRVEIADVKKRQITEERLKHLQAALARNASVTHWITRRLKLSGKVDEAVRTLSEARREASGAILARRRTVFLLVLLSALTGLATGALLTLIVFDHFLERDFKESTQLMGLGWACTHHGGFIANQDNGTFCVFQKD